MCAAYVDQQGVGVVGRKQGGLPVPSTATTKPAAAPEPAAAAAAVVVKATTATKSTTTETATVVTHVATHAKVSEGGRRGGSVK